MAWESGKTMPSHIKDKLSQAEISYYKNYIELIDDYNKSFDLPFGMDLMVDMTPPKDLYIEVRVKVEMGMVTLPESGQVTLQKNSTHLLRRSEVDDLLKKGFLEEIKC
jgi:GINS complex subunit 1